MLRTKLFRGFVSLVALFSVLSAFVGVRTITHREMDEAKTRVRLDLSSAWAVYNSQLHQIETVLRLAALKEVVQDAALAGGWQDPEVRQRLDRIRLTFDFDFLDLLSPEGQVMMRTTPPFHTGDYRSAEPAVVKAQRGERSVGMTLMSYAELQQEGDGLAERAYLELEETPRARKTEKTVERRGMVMVGAVPVLEGGQVIGIVYGGVLVNRNHELIDRIHDVVYKKESYNGTQLGTATIFLHDSRIATTVRMRNGNRALGTRVSKEVADQVLDNGRPWIGEAFVVNDIYISAYEPIRDGLGRIIGMLYVGILKRPYDDYAREVALRYLLVSMIALLAAVVLAFLIAGRLSQPIHRLVAASDRMRHGEWVAPVQTDGACHETEALIVAFNKMAETLAEREERLKALNRSYMETLGFVSHELKSPVATIVNYVYLLRRHKLGPLTEGQEKAARAIEAGSTRLVEMVRHYLNLSRIENQELQPVLTRVNVQADVIAPLLTALEADLESRGMCVQNDLDAGVVVHADMNMVREVFENLLGNAVKYGRDGGCIAVRSEPDGDFVRFSVWNEGEGIPADKMDSLFHKFSRINGSDAARKQKGTGLGLFITKNIVEAHGGKVEAKSAEGEWAEFSFTLPAFGEDSGTAHE